jgi:putative membrane protein
MSALGGDAQRGGSRAGLGVLALLLTSMHMTLLGALLALPPRALYAHVHHAETSGLTGLEDQHLGGAIMLVVGGASYLAGGLWLSACLLQARRAPKAEPQPEAGAIARRDEAHVYRGPT